MLVLKTYYLKTATFKDLTLKTIQSNTYSNAHRYQLKITQYQAIENIRYNDPISAISGTQLNAGYRR